jgi:hypothetical protein
MTEQLAKTDEALNLEEADRLAARLRPSWETDDDDMPPPGFGVDKTLESAPLAEAGPPAGSTGPHDTIVEGGASAEAKPAAATKHGLGEAGERSSEPAIVSAPIVAVGDPTPIAATPDRPAPPSRRTKKAKTEESAAPGVSAEAATEPVVGSPSSSPPPALAPVAPEAASFSKVDDPIELPVQQTSKTLVYVIGGAVALAAIVGGIMMFSGDKKPDAAENAAPAKTSEAAAPAPTTQPTSAPTPAQAAQDKPAETAAPAPTDAPTAQASSAPASTGEPAKQEPAKQEPPKQEPKPVAAAKPEQPKSSGSSGGPSSGSSSGNASSGGTTKKPPKSGSGGGIMRDTPF